MTRFFDLAIAWDWEYDNYFVNHIENVLQNQGISTYRISYYNIEETLQNLKRNQIKFRYYFDRTADEPFYPLVKFIEKSDTQIFNPGEYTKRSNDKATMHLEFITAGINVPFTIIISPFNSKKEIELSLSDLAKLGRPFIIKPANNTGGGVGVVTGAETLKDIINTRQHQKDDKYLIQEKINPVYFDSMRAWFRGFYAFGKIFISWWDDQAHRYYQISDFEEKVYRLDRIKKTVSIIRKVCNLDFFSSEIAISRENKIVVVDYVNDMCDMRPQSECFDGVPDNLINEITHSMANFIKKRVKNVR